LIYSGREENFDMNALSKIGRIDDVPNWYYDPATNSIQNGGINPANTKVTSIPKNSFRKTLEIGLSEQIWSPIKN
jgi:hypothetical protein